MYQIGSDTGYASSDCPEWGDDEHAAEYDGESDSSDSDSDDDKWK